MNSITKKAARRCRDRLQLPYPRIGSNGFKRDNSSPQFCRSRGHRTAAIDQTSASLDSLRPPWCLRRPLNSGCQDNRIWRRNFLLQSNIEIVDHPPIKASIEDTASACLVRSEQAALRRMRSMRPRRELSRIVDGCVRRPSDEASDASGAEASTDADWPPPEGLAALIPGDVATPAATAPSWRTHS